MQINATAIEVIHNQAMERFEAHIEGMIAVADYQIRGNRMLFTHTGTPPALRGRGIAEKLVRAGLDYARANELTVVPLCSYVVTFVERHPEYQDLVGE